MKATIMTLMTMLALVCAACGKCDKLKLTREQWKQVSSWYSENVKNAKTAGQTNGVWRVACKLVSFKNRINYEINPKNNGVALVLKKQKYVKPRKCIYTMPWPKAGFEK